MRNEDDRQDKSGAKSSGNAMPSPAVDAVGRKLKARYDQILREPIPDKLMQLLDDLESSEGDSSDAKKVNGAANHADDQSTSTKRGQ